MKKYAVILAAAALIATGVFSVQSIVLAQDEKPAGACAGCPRASECAKPFKAVITGKNYCVEEALGLLGDAEKNISECRHALCVSSVEIDGEVQEGCMEGRTLHYLFNGTAKALSSDKQYFDKDVTVTGTVYVKEGMISVESIELAGAEDEDPGFEWNVGQSSGEAE